MTTYAETAVPGWLAAGGWGLFAGAALVVGAAIAWTVRVPARVGCPRAWWPASWRSAPGY
ncbi:hypothetical protein [Mycolicibacterium psychrotolerans]|uniref:Uncharacterized protein n=1 Tax=Mycolicibacterium psychrotolerans TaxID=216929 RepID=A0A7I7MKF4_9MYCO|nr:hypothetical protein [Mycolicibacterium psychrotolerans]BBX71729.1 hypothetical protein MPSYJ_51900 [Mycolicibacterium psychrotolerans]